MINDESTIKLELSKIVIFLVKLLRIIVLGVGDYWSFSILIVNNINGLIWFVSVVSSKTAN